MTNKDFVAMGHEVCPVCGCEHSASVLIHKKLRAIDPEKTCTGYSLCDEHRKLFDQGYIAMVAIDEQKSQLDRGVAYRTGEIVHLSREAAADLLTTEVAPNCPMVYTTNEAIERLKGLMAPTQQDSVN